MEDNIGVNYRPIKSLREFLSITNSELGKSATYNYEFKHLHIDIKILSCSFFEFTQYVEELRKNVLQGIYGENVNLFRRVPEFNLQAHQIYEINYNGVAVLEFLIEKGGVFVMLPPQERVKEVPNE